MSKLIKTNFALGEARVPDHPGERFLITKKIGSIGKWERYVSSSKFLNDQGVLVPKIYHDFSSIKDLIITEELIVGKPLSKKPLNSEIVGKVVRSILALHKISSPSWGSLNKKRRKRGFFHHTVQKIENLLKLEGPNQSNIPLPINLKGIVETLESNVREYEFIHGDLHGENMIVTDSGIWFIDLVRSGFGSYAKDLVRIDIWERETFGTHFIRDEYIKAVSDPFLKEKLLLFYTEALIRHIVKYRRKALEIREAIVSLQNEVF